MLNVTSLLSRFSRWSNETQAERVVLNRWEKRLLAAAMRQRESTCAFGDFHRLQEKPIHLND